MAHVLIGFAEALPAPEVFFSLHDAGHTVSAFAREGCRAPITRHLPLVGLHEIAAPERDAAASAAQLRAIFDGPDAPELVLPLDDAALWLTARAELSAGRIAGAVGPRSRLALDKTLQIAAAEAAGFAVPRTVVMRRAADLSAPLPYPAIAKPALAIAERDGAIAKDKVHYLDGASDAARLAREIEAGGDDAAPLLVQPLIAGVGEGLFGFATAQGVTHWSGHRRLRMMNPHGSGSSACAALTPEPGLIAAATRFVEAAEWRGPFMIELLRDAAGTAWFMELNGRMWGSMALARGRGLDYPAWAIAQAQEPGYAPPVRSTSETGPSEARHLGRDLLHLLFVLRGPRTDFYREGWPRLGESLSGVLRPRRDRVSYNAHPDFPGFAMREALYTLRRGLGGRG